MNPGTLDRYVSLRRLDTSLDAIGGVVESWTHVAWVWAQKLPEKGREFIAAQARVAEAAAVFRIRYRTDIAATWRIFCEGVGYQVAAPPVEVGRRSFLDLILKSAPPSDPQWPLSNVFDLPLAVGSIAKQVTYPITFKSAPAGLYVQLIVPTGLASFPISVSAETAAGFLVDFGAIIPAAGYKLSVQAFQYEQTFTLNLEDGAASQAVEFDAAFPSVPRGLKATLLPPSDGYEFTAALVVKSLTAAGFSLEFGAVVPGPGYRALIQVSL